MQSTYTRFSGLAAARVVVRNRDTGVEVNLRTNNAGVYLATELVPGPYTIHAEGTGFNSADITGVVVSANTTIAHDTRTPHELCMATFQ